MKLVKCVICGKVKKTNANKSFNCCSTRQEINDENWLNKKAVTTENKEKTTTSTKTIEINSSTETNSNEDNPKKPEKVEPEPPKEQIKEPEPPKEPEQSKEPEKDLELKTEDDNLEDIEKTHPYLCNGCGTRLNQAGFDEAKGSCPECKTEWLL